MDAKSLIDNLVAAVLERVQEEAVESNADLRGIVNKVIEEDSGSILDSIVYLVFDAVHAKLRSEAL